MRTQNDKKLTFFLSIFIQSCNSPVVVIVHEQNSTPTEATIHLTKNTVADEEFIFEDAAFFSTH